MNIRCWFISVFLLVVTVNGLGQVNIEKLRAKTNDTVSFGGEVNLSLQYDKGNNDYQRINSFGLFQIDLDSSYVLIFYNLEYGLDERDPFSDLGLLHYRHIFPLTAKRQLEYFMQINYDADLLLQLRTVYGLSYRYTIIPKEKYKISAGIGSMVEYEKLNVTTEDHHRARNLDFRINSYLISQISLNGKASVLLTIYYQPAINDFDDYRILAEATLSSEITKHWSFTLSAMTRVDSKQPATIKRTDIRSKAGLKYQF